MELENNKRIPINKWKVAFVVILGIIIGASIFLCIRITGEREPDRAKIMSEIEQTDASFQIELNKAQANAIVNNFLTDFQKNSSIKYEFILEKRALLVGTFVFLGEEIQFYLYFTPLVEDNGDLTLKATSVSIGKLEIPKSELLIYVKNNYDLPDWVEVKSAENSIVLHLTQIQTAGGMRIAADEIDLINDEILFTASVY